MLIELLRTFERAPDGKGKFFFKFRAENQADLAQVENVIPRGELPAGHHLVANWIGQWEFTLALEPDAVVVAGAKPARKGDGLDQLEDKDLMTKMAEMGLKYDAKKFHRFNGIQAIRDKLKDQVSHMPEPVGAGV